MTNTTRATGPAEPASASRPRPAPMKRLPVWVVLMAVVCVAFSFYGVSRYISYDPALARTLPRPHSAIQFPLLATHVMFGGVAIALCWLQVWPWFRANHPVAHRRIGWTYLVLGVFPAGLLAIPVAILVAEGHSVRVAFLTLAVLWLLSAALGLRATLQRRYADHRVWMLRNVALTTSIVTMRPLSYGALALMSSWLPNTYPANSIATVIQMEDAGFWASIVIHLVVVEWIILRKGRSAPRPAARIATVTSAPVEAPASAG
jgi:hypothetical protein